MSGIESIHLVGGNVCLDFANSVNAHSSGSPRDNLKSYGDLLIWSRRAGILSVEVEKRLRAKAEAEPRAAQRTLVEARRLRETIFQFFMVIASGSGDADRHLSAFNEFFERAMRSARIVRQGAEYEVDFDGADRLDQMLAPIAWSAAELLKGGELGRVKSCSDHTCGWLFVDRSKNHSRRWCEMSDCGNQAKAKRFYQKRAARASGRAN